MNNTIQVTIVPGLTYDAIDANTAFTDESTLPLNKVIHSTNRSYEDTLVPITLLPTYWRDMVEDNLQDITNTDYIVYELDDTTPIKGDPEGSHVWFHPNDHAYLMVTPTDRWIQHVYAS